MKTVVITGVAGLIGSRMAQWILDNQPDFQVIGVDNLSGGYQDFIPEGVEFHQLDLASGDLAAVVGGRNVETVYHFAAYAAEGLSPFIRKYNYTNNLVATANVINFCINTGVNRVVFTSSMAVYGVGTPPFDEADLPQPIDPYGVAKYACEMDFKIAFEQHGLEYCIIRPHNVYGQNQNIWDKYRNVLGIWMFQKLNDQPFTVFGEGKQMRAFSYIDDILKPLWVAATADSAKNQIINLGGIEETSIIDAARLLADIVGGSEIQFLEQRHEVMYAFPTYQKSIDCLGYQQQTGLKEGLEKMWSWALTLPRRERFVWDTYEIEKGLYAYWRK